MTPETALQEASRLKAEEVAECCKSETFKTGEHEISILSVETDKFGALVTMVQASCNGEPCGFGPDGSIETERFRFVNPPTMVPSGSHTEEFEGEKYEVTDYTKDPAEALRQIVADAVKGHAKGSAYIVPGKVGSTVTTVFATYGAMIYNSVTNQTWATVHDATAGTNVDTTDNRWVARIDNGTPNTTYNLISRTGFTFDTSSIPDTDAISAAVLSIFGSSTTNTNTDSTAVKVNVYDFTPASDSTYVTGDFDQFGTTVFSTSIAFASWSTSAYNAFTLNASGIADISKTGNTVIGVREADYDATNTALPSASANAVHRFGYRNYTASGTTNDPKLAVTHAATTAIKTVDGLAQASVKTVMGLAIASVKTIDGLA